MPLPRFNEIHVRSIHAVAPGHPVFVLRGNPGEPCYVLKKESFAADYGGERNYGNPYDRPELIRDGTVDEAKRRLIDNVENMKKSFEFMAETYAKCTNHLPAFRVLDAFELTSAFNKLQSFNQNHELFNGDFISEQKSNKEIASSIWTLIDCVFGLFDWKGLAEKQLPQGDVTARQVIQFVKHIPDVALELGRIVAVDCFFGNNDRAGWGYDWNHRTYAWRAENKGNFFLVNTQMGGHSAFCGIDFFDPNSRFKNLYGDFDTQPTETSPWPGVTFLNAKESAIKLQTNRLLDSLNTFMVENQCAAVFEGAHKSMCAKGFTEGAAALKKFVNKRTDKPPAVKRRKALLGW